MKRLPLILIFLSALILATGCGDSDDSSTTDATADGATGGVASTGGTASTGGSATTGGATTGGMTGTGGDTGASTIQSVVESTSWGSNVTINVESETFNYTSDGVPVSGTLPAYALSDGTTVSVVETQHNYDIPLNPEVAASTTATSLGVIGVSIDGAVFFNPYEGDGTTIAIDSNFDVNGIPFIDACNGHPLQDGATYHYHGVPYCITEMVDVAGEHSRLIGFMLDGFPVYGPQDVNGEAPTDLDACSSHFGPTPEFPEGIRHYHLTETAPYSIDCYVGTPNTTGGGGGMMGPGPRP